MEAKIVITVLLMTLWAFRLWERGVPSLYAVPFLTASAWAFVSSGTLAEVVRWGAIVLFLLAGIFWHPPRGGPRDKGGEKRPGFRERMTEVARAAFRREARGAV